MESLCKYCEPQLSSVVLPEYDVGYRAAALLDRLMAGRKAPVRDVLLPPEGVVLRGSTDVLAVENPHMRAVVEYIRTHDGDVFGVERLMEQVPLSRRSLELKFHEALGCTLYQYLCKIRVDKAKNLLLARADAKLRDVAAACGFSCNKRFRIVFRRLTGRRPAEYRREHLRSRAQ